LGNGVFVCQRLPKPALETWKDEGVSALSAQQALYQVTHWNLAARRGLYTPLMEKK
jgi:hypothetical protein